VWLGKRICHLMRCQDFRRRSFCDHSAIQKQHAVGMGGNTQKIMGYHENRNIQRGEEFFNNCQKKINPCRINPCHRLIEEQNIGVGGKRQTKKDPLQFPAGEITNTLSEEMAGRYGIKRFGNLQPFSLGNTEPDWSVAGGRGKQIGNTYRRLAIEIERLRHIANAWPVLLFSPDLPDDPAGIGNRAQYCLEQRTFSGAIGTNNG